MKVHPKQTFIRLIFLIFILGLVSSCVPRERIVYFQGDSTSIEKMAGDYAAVIRPDDLLSISVFGRNQEATKIFNQESNITNVGSGGTLNRPTYLVDTDGNIEFPVLGKIKLSGLTRNQAIQHLKELLSDEIVDPGVAISIDNYRVTVLGEVSKPGTYSLSHEKVTLLEALGMAGDLTINGVRNNVLVIREEGDDKNLYRVDLTSEEIFTSPVFYLTQNDVVYVEPNQNKINTSSNTIRDVSFGVSIASFLITIITLITR